MFFHTFDRVRRHILTRYGFPFEVHDRGDKIFNVLINGSFKPAAVDNIDSDPPFIDSPSCYFPLFLFSCYFLIYFVGSYLSHIVMNASPYFVVSLLLHYPTLILII